MFACQAARDGLAGLRAVFASRSADNGPRYSLLVGGRNLDQTQLELDSSLDTEVTSASRVLGGWRKETKEVVG